MSIRQTSQKLSLTLTILVGLCLVATLWRGTLHFWAPDGITLVPFLYWKRILIIAGVISIFNILRQRERPKDILLSIGLWGLFAMIASDWLFTPYTLFRMPSIRGEILIGITLFYFLLRKGFCFRFLSLFGASAAIALACLFLHSTKGNLLFSDDHPVFLQRLILLKENFPWIPFYNPLWNLGIDQRDFFATGVLGIFLLLSPILYLVDISQSYTYIIALLLFCLLPIGTSWATHRATKSWPASAIASILFLGNSLIWYRWALKYGTLGFLFSASLVPLVISILCDFLDKKRNFSVKEGILLVSSTSLMMLWSPTALVFIPIGIYGLTAIPQILRDKSRLISAASLVILNLAWISIFVCVSRVSSFVVDEKDSKRKITHQLHIEESVNPTSPEFVTSAQKSLKILRDWGSSEHPIILMLLIPALLSKKTKNKKFIVSTVVWCLIMGTFGAIYLPHLELDRMLLVAGLISIPPIAELLLSLASEYFSAPLTRKALTLLSLSLVAITPFTVASVLLNRSVEHFEVARPVVSQLSEAIRLFGGNGRTVFSGFILHELNGGHIAPLAHWSGKQLIASSHVHDKWRYTSVFPESFLAQGDLGIERYLDLVNATSVVAHEANWISFFRAKANLYQELWRHDKFVLFARKNYISNYLLEGSATISRVKSNEIQLIPSSESLILKYQYFPFLTSSQCTLSGQVIDGINFIKLSNCRLHVPMTIKAKTGWHRVTW